VLCAFHALPFYSQDPSSSTSPHWRLADPHLGIGIQALGVAVSAAECGAHDSIGNALGDRQSTVGLAAGFQDDRAAPAVLQQQASQEIDALVCILTVLLVLGTAASAASLLAATIVACWKTAKPALAATLSSIVIPQACPACNSGAHASKAEAGDGTLRE
jgi:hypothetical protein